MIVFFKILICSSWDNSSTNILPQFFILTKSSWRIFAIKGGMYIFHILRVILYGRWLIKLFIPVFRDNISVVIIVFRWALMLVAVEIISSMCLLFFVRCQDLLIFHLQKFENSFPVYVNHLICLIYITHLTSDIEVPGSSPGSLTILHFNHGHRHLNDVAKNYADHFNIFA